LKFCRESLAIHPYCLLLNRVIDDITRGAVDQPAAPQRAIGEFEECILTE
jgi:hypothetical protein